MVCHVKLYGTLQKHYQGDYPACGIEIEFHKTISVADLLELVGIPKKSVSMVSVNGRLAKEENCITDGAEVKLFQLVSGG